MLTAVLVLNLLFPETDNINELINMFDVFVSTQVSHLFDNEGTVAFAMFMAIWGECLIQCDVLISNLL